MKDKIFVDTNIFVYAYTDGKIKKHEIAKEFLQDSRNTIVISTQVLSEFYSTLLKLDIEHNRAVFAIDEILNYCIVESVNLKTVRVALALKKRYGFSYWDTLILSSALENNCKYLISEDMQHNQMIDNSLTITNIFV